MDFDFVEPQTVAKLTDDERSQLGKLAVCVHPAPEGEKPLTLRSLRKLITDLEKST